MIILRKEKFGGLIFNTENAIQLFIDGEGYAVCKKYFARKILKSKEKNFISEIKKNLETRTQRDYKIIENAIGQKDFPFEVLSAPTLADIQITSRCNLYCPHCYANGSSQGSDILWSDFVYAIKSFSKAGVFQIALGGGEPTLHPRFIDMLQFIRKEGMVPNLTTNGKELNNILAAAMAKYCGAIALSVEGIGDNFEKRRNFLWKKLCSSAYLLKKKGNRLVFQITVSSSNVSMLSDIVRALLKFSPHGIIFLAYKPVGRGKFFDSALSHNKYDKIRCMMEKAVHMVPKNIKIGFDCCFAPAIIGMAQYMPDYDLTAIEGCSAMRNSFAVTKELDVLPCSFINTAMGNLKKISLQKIWFGSKASDFRRKFNGNMEKTACKNCSYKLQCLGGCPKFDLVRCSLLSNE